MKWPWMREEPAPLVQIDPDPRMASGEWEWSCVNCDAGGTGPDQEIRAESMRHCLATGHAVKGSAVESAT